MLVWIARLLVIGILALVFVAEKTIVDSESGMQAAVIYCGETDAANAVTKGKSRCVTDYLLRVRTIISVVEIALSLGVVLALIAFERASRKRADQGNS